MNKHVSEDLKKKILNVKKFVKSTTHDMDTDFNL